MFTIAITIHYYLTLGASPAEALPPAPPRRRPAAATPPQASAPHTNVTQRITIITTVAITITIITTAAITIHHYLTPRPQRLTVQKCSQGALFLPFTIHITNDITIPNIVVILTEVTIHYYLITTS